MGVTLGNIPLDQIEGLASSVISPHPGYYLGPFMIGYVPLYLTCRLGRESETRILTVYRFLMDAVFFGMGVQLYIRWHSYSKDEEKPIVRYLVVSPILSNCYGRQN
jgi:hypothetical protein